MILTLSVLANITFASIVVCLVFFIWLLNDSLKQANDLNKELLKKYHLLLDRNIIYSKILLLIYNKGSKKK